LAMKKTKGKENLERRNLARFAGDRNYEASP
jgi:hypothetical protein